VHPFRPEAEIDKSPSRRQIAAMTHTSRTDRVVALYLKDCDVPDLAARAVTHAAAIAFASVADCITIARDGTLDPAAAARQCIGGLEMVDVRIRPASAASGGGRIRRLHIRVPGKLAALDILARHLKLPIARREDHPATILADRVIEEYAGIAHADMSDYLAVAEDGTAQLDLRRTRRAQLAALRELVVEQHIERAGGLAPVLLSWRLKLAPKQRALAALARYGGVLGTASPARLEEPGATRH